MRRLRSAFPILLTLVLLRSGVALASPKREVELSWSELQSFVGQQIALTLPDGTYLEGKAVAFDSDSLRLYVKKTSARVLHPRGETRIPRALISQFEYRSKSPIWFPVGTVFGTMAGATGGAFLGGVIGNGVGSVFAGRGGGIAGALLGAVQGSDAGRRIGKEIGATHFDFKNETTLIHLIPDPTHSAPSLDPPASSEATSIPEKIESAAND